MSVPRSKRCRRRRREKAPIGEGRVGARLIRRGARDLAAAGGLATARKCAGRLATARKCAARLATARKCAGRLATARTCAGRLATARKCARGATKRQAEARNRAQVRRACDRAAGGGSRPRAKGKKPLRRDAEAFPFRLEVSAPSASSGSGRGAQKPWLWPAWSWPPAAFSSFGRSATRHSVVSIRLATEAAFWSAVRTTFTGSMTPMPRRLPY